MRIAYYAINGIGLGHLARTCAIARALDALGGHEHLFLTSSPALHLVRDAGYAYLQFPSDHFLADKSMPLRDKTYARLLHGMVATAVNAFDPHVFVVDTLPHGVRGEFAQITHTARRTAFVLRERTSIDAASAAAIAAYDRVLVPHPPGPVPDGIDASKAIHTGPILLCDRHSALDRIAARATLGIPTTGKPVVGVAFGGGGDAECAELIRWAVGIARRHPHLLFVISLPPLLDDTIGSVADGNVQFTRHSPLASVWSAFDFVVSAPGYTSANELLHLGIPTVFVPRQRPLDDQFARAASFAESGAALVAEAFGDASVDEAIARMGSDDARQRISANACQAIPENGAAAAAAALIELAHNNR